MDFLDSIGTIHKILEVFDYHQHFIHLMIVTGLFLIIILLKIAFRVAGGKNISQAKAFELQEINRVFNDNHNNLCQLVFIAHMGCADFFR